MVTVNLQRSLWVSAFAAAFALVEAAVVVYLRALYYPGGFIFPLSVMEWQHVAVEIAREAATIFMLASVGILAGHSRWQRIGFFLIAFAVWDIFYYLWLKVLLDWPATIFDWDVLFLIPIPWIGPVLAPVLISLLLLCAAWVILVHEQRSPDFHLKWFEAVITIASTSALLYTFMADTPATLHAAAPQPYNYPLFITGTAGYGIVLARIWRRLPKTG